MKAVINGQNFGFADKTLVVSKSVGIYECEFVFDSSWDGWNKTAVFEGSGVIKEHIIVNGKSPIPWEVLKEDGWLKVGVKGTQGEKEKPTIWGNRLQVNLGTPSGESGTEPTPSIYAQILEVATNAEEVANGVKTEWESVSATAETLPSGSSATASFDGEVFTFGIPQGEKGEDGDTPTFTVTPIVTPTYSGNRITIETDGSVTIFDVKNGANGAKGADGVGIADIEITSSYRLQITYTDGSMTITAPIRGETGNGIESITKTATVGKVDTYTITYTDGTTTTFDVTNGEVTEASLEERLIDKADVIENSASGTIATFSDGAEMPVKSLEVEINAVQDLHGQANPYPAGGGKNLYDDSTLIHGYFPATNTNITSDEAYRVVSLNLKAGTYTLSLDWSQTAYLIRKYQDGVITSIALNTNTYTFTTTTDGQFMLSFRRSDSATITETIKVQVESGSTATAYAPYENLCPISGYSSVNVVDCGKNLFDTNNLASTPMPLGDRNGVTINKTGTYTIHADAVGTGSAYIYAYPVYADGTYGALKYIVAGTARTTGVITITDGMKLIVVDAVGTNSMATSKALFESWAVQIELGSTASSYEEYQGTTYPITLPSTCYGGKIKDGVLTDTYSDDQLELSTLNWQTTNTAHIFYASIIGMKAGYADPIVCDSYKFYSGYFAGMGDMSIAKNSTYNFIYLKNSNWDTVADINLTGVKVVYPLATPIEISLSDYPTIETLTGVNNLWADSGDVAVIYRADTKAYIDGTIVDVPLAMIAPIENGTTSSKAYAVGEYFILNGNQFCKAKTAIASGATFTLNTNYTVTTIGAELKALQ